jgi:hypothetical protein
MLKELQLACRRVTTAPSSQSMAVMTLALAIGANTQIFQ